MASRNGNNYHSSYLQQYLRSHSNRYGFRDNVQLLLSLVKPNLRHIICCMSNATKTVHNRPTVNYKATLAALFRLLPPASLLVGHLGRNEGTQKRPISFISSKMAAGGNKRKSATLASPVIPTRSWIHHHVVFF